MQTGHSEIQLPEPMTFLCSSWDCNVYLTPDGRIYKSFDPRCPGVVLENKKNPVEKILSIQSPIAEPILGQTETGFYSEYMPRSLGSLMRVNAAEVKEIGVDKLIQFVSDLDDLNRSGLFHQDIWPAHVRYSEREQRFVLIDWTHLNAHPASRPFFTGDDWASLRLRQIIGSIKESDEIVWFENCGTMPLYWITAALVKWILTSIDVSQLRDACKFFMIFKDKAFTSVVDLCVFLRDYWELDKDWIETTITAIEAIVSDSLYDWIRVYGEPSVLRIMTLGLAANVWLKMRQKSV